PRGRGIGLHCEAREHRAAPVAAPHLAASVRPGSRRSTMTETKIEPTPEAGKPTAAAEGAEKANILLGDDQGSRLLRDQAIVGDLGQNLVTARGGMEALDRLMKDEYAVILLDVSMPGMDGFETATIIHQHPRFEKTPIIFVTAFHMTDLD